MPNINIINIDGVTVAKSTTVTNDQAQHFISLTNVIKDARERIRFTEGQQNAVSVSGTLDEIHPLTVRQLLPRLSVLMAGEAMPVHPSMFNGAAHLRNANDPSINHDGGPLNTTKINPSVASLSGYSPAGDYLQQARNLGMLLANENAPYSRVELVGGPAPCALRWR